ncbi:MAG: ABC transporter substrate-binding protein [Pseudomonadota bacterium]|jgi:ABC-type branched-subunit amino acid transport system substrate-binding protein
MPSKRLLASLLLICASLWLSPQANCAPLKIGIPLPLTGANAAPAQDIRRGFELGREMLGLTDVELIFEDDTCDGAKSITANKKLLEINKVDIISGIYCNTALLAAAPLLNRANIPVLTVGATTGDQIGIGKKIFRLFPADQGAVEPLISEMAKHGSRLCVMTEAEAYSALIERTVARKWPILGSNFKVIKESVNAGEYDFRTPLLRLRKRGCDSILLNASGDDGFIASYRQLRTIDRDIPAFALYYPGSSTVQKAFPEGLRNVSYADIVSRGTLATTKGNEFTKRYQDRYGAFLISQPIALLAFEAIRVIAESHKQGIPLDQFLQRGAINDGAIKEYSFDSDGAVQGIEFIVLKADSTQQER